MTTSPSTARRPSRIALIVLWAVVAVAAAVAVLFGALTAALNGAGFDTRFSSPTPLFVLSLLASVAAGVCGILLGGRWWTAPLVAAPALLFAVSFLVGGQWVSTALTLSPVLTLVGVGCVLTLPRRRITR